MALQYLVERVNCFLQETSEGLTTGFQAQHSQGVLIADTRQNNLDLNVAVSHLSFIFGNPIGLTCLRVIEAPTFTFSQLSVGLQLTDIFAACMYVCQNLPEALPRNRGWLRLLAHAVLW